MSSDKDPAENPRQRDPAAASMGEPSGGGEVDAGAANRALKESETRFRMLAENIRQVFWMSTPSVKKMIYVSPAYEEIWGRPVGAVMDNPLAWTEAVHPDDQSRVMEALTQHAEGRYQVEYRIIRPDGSMRWIFDQGFPVFDEQDRLTYMTGIAEDITERKATEEMRRVRDLAAHLQTAREDERKRIAREIHDELGQVFTGLKLEIGWAVERCRTEPKRVHERLSRLPGIIDQAFRSLRRISADLRPEALDSGLVDAVRWQAGELQRTTSLDCNLQLPDEEIDIDGQQSTAMFRILQEALTNVVRHAHAKSVHIRVSQAAGTVELEVADDGCGIRDGASQNPRAFGLLGMNERARLAGGTLSVAGRPAGGTIVLARLPRELPDS